MKGEAMGGSLSWSKLPVTAEERERYLSLL